MRHRPSSNGALFLLGLGLLAVAGESGRAAAAEPLVPAAAKTTSAEGGPSARPDAKPGSEAQKRARRLFHDAEAHFAAGLFAEALGEYQAGYDADALPGFLVNIAQCQRRLGNLTGALTTYRKFIMVAPDSPYVPQVEALMDDLEKLARDAERDRERSGSARPGARAPGAEAVRSGGGLPETKRLPLEPGRSASGLEARPPAAPEAAALIDRPDAAAPRASSTRWWWIGGAAALVAVAGGTAAVLALRSGDSTTLHEGSLGSLRR